MVAGALNSAASRYPLMLRIWLTFCFRQAKMYSTCELLMARSRSLTSSAGYTSPAILIISFCVLSVSTISSTISSNCSRFVGVTMQS